MAGGTDVAAAAALDAAGGEFEPFAGDVTPTQRLLDRLGRLEGGVLLLELGHAGGMDLVTLAELVGGGFLETVGALQDQLLAGLGPDGNDVPAPDGGQVQVVRPVRMGFAADEVAEAGLGRFDAVGADEEGVVPSRRVKRVLEVALAQDEVEDFDGEQVTCAQAEQHLGRIVGEAGLRFRGILPRIDGHAFLGREEEGLGRLDRREASKRDVCDVSGLDSLEV